MSLDAVQFSARQRPNAVAMVDVDHVEYTYLEVQRHIAALAAQILKDCPDIRELQPVAVSHRDKRLHIYLIYALEALGVTSMPFVQPIDPGFEHALGVCQLVLAEQPTPLVLVRHLLLTSAWIAAALQLRAALTPRRWRDEEVAVILTTSGSTGAAKAIPLPWRAFAVRERSRLYQYGFTSKAVFLVALPPSVFSIFLSIRCVFRCGGRILIWNMHDPAGSLLQATHTTMLPMHLRLLLDGTPASYTARQVLRLMSVGAPLSAALRAGVAARFNARVLNLYGSNELGGALIINADDSSDMYPGVDMEVVDQAGAALPRGVPGLIRARSAGMALRYVDAAQTRERFVDGWFLTGDMGVMRGYRQIQLLGRTDSLLNIGGTKIAPEGIEDNLMQRGIAQDLAVCSMADGDRIERLHVAIAGTQVDEAVLVATLVEALGANFGTVRVVYLARIPRNQAGKVQRAELLREVGVAAAQVPVPLRAR